MKPPNGGSRRDFIKKLGGGVLLAGAASCLPHVEGDWSSCLASDGGSDDLNGCSSCATCPKPPANRVVEVISSQVLDLDPTTQELKGIRQEVVDSMLSAGLLALAGTSDLSQAWATILQNRKEKEVVGFKVNALNAQVPTTAELMRSLVTSVTSQGSVPKEDVLVWDRSDRDLQKCGLTTEALGVPCRGTLGREAGTGPGYEKDPVCLTGKKIYLSTLLTRTVCHLINVAVLKNHGVAGVTGCLKNHYGSFSTPEQFHDNCEQHIANLNALPEILRVSRLQVIDALIGIALGDTASPFDCFPRRLLFGFDPVAVDQRGFEVREEMRRELGAKPGAPAGYLKIAADLGLGTTEYDLITINLG